MIVNILDGGFFGFGLGFSSFTTIIPLFVSQMTNSALLIGLIPGIHVLGWQLPQLLTAPKISTLNRFKPFILIMTVNERLPYLGLALTAWFLPRLGNTTGLLLTFLLLVWQGLGGGVSANAWQNMIGKIIPPDQRATFFGLQSALSNLLSSIGAIAAGVILDRLSPSAGFSACFVIAFLLFVISWIFVRSTRESEHKVILSGITQMPLWSSVVTILKKDHNFTWFLAARILTQFGLMAFAFYIVYAVNAYGMSVVTAGIMTSILLITQVTANPLLGKLADRWGRKFLLTLGSIVNVISALLAAFAPNLSWFVLVFFFAGLANTAFWTIGLTMSIDFGEEHERPTYIGMANTLVAPAALIAPLLGGWLADQAGYPATFIFAAGAAMVTALVYHFFITDLYKQRT